MATVSHSESETKAVHLEIRFRLANGLRTEKVNVRAAIKAAILIQNV